MALDLDGAADYLTVPTAAVSQDEGTIVMWAAPDFLPSTTTANIFNDVDGTRILAYKTSTTNINQLYNDARVRNFTVTGLWTTGVYSHFAHGYKKSSDTQTLWINGVAATISGSPSGTWGSTALGTSLRIGTNAAISLFFDGDVAEVATYSALLDTVDLVQLAQGYSPLLVRPEKLIGYWTALVDGRQHFGTQVATLVSAPPVSAHTKVFYPSRPASNMAFLSGTTYNELATFAASVGFDPSMALTMEGAAAFAIEAQFQADAVGVIEVAATLAVGLGFTGAAASPEKALRIRSIDIYPAETVGKVKVYPL